MKKIGIALLMSLFFHCTHSQETSVARSIYGVQTGFLGIWVHNETKLTSEIVLRSEIGFDTGIWAGKYYEKTGFVFAPVLRVEPRWYYNLEKRRSKSKKIDKNSGNFFSLETYYHPDWFVISNNESVNIITDIGVIPTWGIKRTLGNHFTYETGVGLGYRYFFAKQAGYLENEGKIAINLNLRLGYSF